MSLFELLGSIFIDNREANDEIDDTTEKAKDSSKKISKAFSTIGSGIAKGVGAGAKIAAKSIAAVGAAAATGVTAFLATAESTREYRTELAKLTNMAAQVGTSSDYIKDKWMSMSAVLGDEGAVTEGLNNIMAAGFTTQESIDGITEVLEGAALKWKDTLKFEGLADGLQETLAVGEATGSFAEMLERSGIVLDDFNAGLAACSTEAEKQDYIMQTLANTGLAEVSRAYRDANGDIISAEKAQMQLTDKIAEVGAIAEPIMTSLKLVAVDLLDTFMPFIEILGEGLQGVLNGSAGAAEKLAEGLGGALSTALTTITSIFPTVLAVLQELIPQLLETVIKEIPDIANVLLELIQGLLNTIVDNIPIIIETIKTVVISIVNALPELLNSLIDGIFVLAESLIQALPEVIESLVNAIVEFLPNVIPKLVDGLVSLLSVIVEVLPTIIPVLLQGVQDLITAVLEQLPVILPVLIEGIIALFNSLVEMLPSMLESITALVFAIIDAVIEVLPILLPMIYEGLIQLIGAIVSQIPTLTKTVWDAILNLVSNLLFDKLPQLIVTFIETAAQIIESMPDWIIDNILMPLEESVGAFFDWIADIFSPFIEAIQIGWQQMGEIASDVFSSLKDFASDAWDGIKNIFSNISGWFGEKFQDAYSKVTSIFDKLKSFFSGLWNSIKSVFSSVTSFFGDIFQSAYNKVTSIFNKLKGFFSGLWDSIKTTFSSLGTKIGDAIGGSVKTGINSVLTIIENTINKAIGLINGAIDLINKVPTVEIGHVSTLSLPRLAKGGVLYDDTAFIGGEYANAATNPEIVTPQNIMAETFEVVLTNKMRQISELQNDRLDRILALLSDYIPQLGNKQLVLDTGALVGELVEPMDDALGERTNAKERNRYS